ncbi:MAG: hypothetical protein JNK58_11255 [Phycisphaerae bacterium]|nr:hypothetical protein [Phycisphaerae bacterium]
MYEHRNEPLLTWRAFGVRQSRHLVAAIGLIVPSMAIGAAGYHYFEGIPWIDAVYSATMILTGMGPAETLRHESAKVFATLYALFSGVVFLTAAAVVAAPAVHRLLHSIHLDEDADDPR